MPNGQQVETDLYIENSRISPDGASLHLGVSIKSNNITYQEVISQYTSDYFLGNLYTDQINSFSSSYNLNDRGRKKISIRYLTEDKDLLAVKRLLEKTKKDKESTAKKKCLPLRQLCILKYAF
jgi:hypothetical protein